MQDLGAGKRKKEKVLLQAKGDEDITSMDTTSHIHWSWSQTYFRIAGKHLLATVVTASYGFQFGSSTTPWKDHQVYFETDPAS
jgi:D-alanyl-D-alanine carboxypeptidase